MTARIDPAGGRQSRRRREESCAADVAATRTDESIAARKGRRSERDETFRAFVLRHRATLVRTATLLASGDAHRAEDLVQIALVKVYLAWDRTRPATARAYALRVLTNVFIDEYRRPFFRREQPHAEVPDIASAADLHDSIESDQLAAAVRALGELPPRMRAAVVLRHLHELSVAETAAALGCNEGTVKSQTARGLTRLRDQLARPTQPMGEHAHDRQ